MIDREDDDLDKDGDEKSNVVLFRLPGIPQPDFTTPDAPVYGGSTDPDAKLDCKPPIDPEYAAIIESQGWKILDEDSAWEGSSTQTIIARNVSRVIDSGEIPIPAIELGEKKFTIIGSNNQFSLSSFKPVVFEIVEQLVENENLFVNIRIPGLTLLAIGNRLKKGGKYDLEAFGEELVSLICQALCDQCGFEITATIDSGELICNSEGVILFPDYYDVFIRVSGDPPIKLVE